jgi:hypothetical protein
VLETAWRPAKDTEHVLAAVAAVQAPHWPVLESISSPEAFSEAWEFYLLVSTAYLLGEACRCTHRLAFPCRPAMCAALLSSLDTAVPKPASMAAQTTARAWLDNVAGHDYCCSAAKQGQDGVQCSGQIGVWTLSCALQAKQTEASLQVKRSPRTRSATKSATKPAPNRSNPSGTPVAQR